MEAIPNSEKTVRESFERLFSKKDLHSPPTLFKAHLSLKFLNCGVQASFLRPTSELASESVRVVCSVSVVEC